MEGLAPAPEKRFEAMKKLAAAGILTGTCLMPVLPGLGDDDENMREVVRHTADHGGKFVLFGGLTLSDQQRTYYLDVINKNFPEVMHHYRSCYPSGSYGPVEQWSHQRQVKVYEWCQQYGIKDRMPRPIIRGDKRELNKRIVEELSYQEHLLDLKRASEQRKWSVRNAANAIEDLEQNVGLVYQIMGMKGLQSIAGIDPEMAREVERLIHLYKKTTSGNIPEVV
jgi:hypothetical protein